MGEIVAIVGIVTPLVGLPWIILHYVTQWKKAASITREDENLLDELHELAGSTRSSASSPPTIPTGA